MSCHICGRGACCDSFHSLEEQTRYAKVIAAFEKAEDLRRELREQIAEEIKETAQQEEEAT